MFKVRKGRCGIGLEKRPRRPLNVAVIGTRHQKTIWKAWLWEPSRVTRLGEF
jgi:hypothetical protein